MRNEGAVVLLTSVILVLREFLEAALLVSLLMAWSERMGISSRWVLVSLLIGLLGAAVYGFNIDRVSEWFDGVGQEVVNALLQLGIYALLCLLALLTFGRRWQPPSLDGLRTVMAGAVALAVVREGAEIMIYLTGFLQVREQLTSVVAGSVVGAGIGVSVGAVFYFTLLMLSDRWARIAGGLLVLLVAAGMVSQATQLLIQADWLPSQYPLWDSGWLIDEQSITGQLLYALIGYEATPTGIQVTAYLGSIALMVALSALYRRLRPRKNG